jgi:hypothetical protein
LSLPFLSSSLSLTPLLHLILPLSSLTLPSPLPHFSYSSPLIFKNSIFL